MKIIIVDDNRAFRNTLKDFLENRLGHTVIWESSIGEEFLAKAPMHRADIVLMDIVMHPIDGIEATHRLNICIPWAKIIAVTMHIEKVILLELVSNGFKGCVSKTEIFDKLEMAMNKVYSGELFFPEDIKIK